VASLCVWTYQLISSLCHVKSSTGTGLVDSSAYPMPLSASMLQNAQARGPVTSAAQPIPSLCPSLTDAVWPRGTLNLFASTCVIRTYAGVLRDPCHDTPFPTQALQTRERSTSPRSPVSTASAADGLPAEVLALCGVAGPLRQLDLSVPGAAISRLEDMDCPLEGINTLQVLSQNVNCISWSGCSTSDRQTDCRSAAGLTHSAQSVQHLPGSVDSCPTRRENTFLLNKVPHLGGCMRIWWTWKSLSQLYMLQCLRRLVCKLACSRLPSRQ